MLLRVSIAVESRETEHRLKALIPPEDVLLDLVSGASSLGETLNRSAADLLILEEGRLGEPALQALETIRGVHSPPRLIVLAHAEQADARAALLASGVDAVLNWSLSDDALTKVLTALLSRFRTELVANRDRSGAAHAGGLDEDIPKSEAMLHVRNLSKRVAATDTSILILGETGVGKERLARDIHNQSPRRDGPFVAVNCAAIPETLLESELFGHEKGAFTGAIKTRRGHFELAHRGTFFLDEIGDLPLHLQSKLLRVLQDHVVVPVGAERGIDVDVRIIAATNQDLSTLVQAKGFRDDLYYRLSVVALTVPPLRERRADIPLLAERYLRHFAAQLRRPTNSITPSTMAALVDYPWPGNIRELMNVMERAVLLSDGPNLLPQDLPPSIVDPPSRTPQCDIALATDAGDWLKKPWKDVRKEGLRALERAYFVGVLEATHGHIGKTAQVAGIDPRSLYEKLKEHGIDKETFRPRPKP